MDQWIEDLVQEDLKRQHRKATKRRKSRDSYVTYRDRKIHYHQSFTCEKNGKKKRIETIQAFENATNK